MKVTLESYARNTAQANAMAVTIGWLTLYFSYQTCIAFQVDGHPITIIQNQWGPTTGKHLNLINPDKSRRLEPDIFNAVLDQTVRAIVVG